MHKENITWHGVLKSKGFDNETSQSLIGFLSWNDGEMHAKLGEEINDVLSGYEGKVMAKDVLSSKYGDKGLLFISKELSDETAQNMFEAIIDYEQNDVYDL